MDMKNFLIGMGLLCGLSVCHAERIYNTAEGQYIIPDSSIAHAGDAGKRMTTNLILFKPKSYLGNGLPASCETPASIACIYGLTIPTPGCPIRSTTTLATGGWGAIALVEAYDNPDSESDLQTFSQQFNLPACTTANGCFSLVYATGTQPAFNAGAADEHVLDIEWAHALAPGAKIIMVEAADSSHDALLQAVDVATQAVLQAGGGMVSYSHSSAEYPSETADDVHFSQTPGVVYIASSGDDAAPANYPSSSPYVISAGGTSIVRNAQGNFVGETAWSASGPIGSQSGGSGGPSIYEPRPAFQNSVMKIVGSARGTPDFSFVADPATGVCVYSTVHGGWFRDGGTSLAAPALAGILNSAGFRITPTENTQTLLAYIYTSALKNYHSYWHDIVVGNNGYPALVGYDFTTGLGSPSGYMGK
jgi:kumamolisin